MKNKEVTTIKLSRSTAEALNLLKIHPRQAYEEVILKLIVLHKGRKKETVDFSNKNSNDGNREITTIKLGKSTVDVLNNLKIHPRQPYEEVILELISENEENRKKSRE